jgi:thioredoxin reductase (NADPH)
MQDRAFNNPKIEFIWDTGVEEILGSKETGVTGLRIKNLKTGEESTFKTDGFFVAIGHKPNTELFQGQIDLDERGYVKLSGDDNETNVRGVFAAGDVHDTVYRQAITAAGSGCRAAMDVEHYLESLEDAHS